jgi:hypothetical protein
VIVSDKQHAYFNKLQVELRQIPKYGPSFTIEPAQRAWWVKKHETLGRNMKREYPSTPQEAFEQAVAQAIGQAGATTMLSPSIRRNYIRGVEAVAAHPAVVGLAAGREAGPLQAATRKCELQECEPDASSPHLAKLLPPQEFPQGKNCSPLRWPADARWE